MSSDKDSKLKALQLTLDRLDKTYGKGTVMKMGDAVQEDIEFISSGSIGLDYALGIGGYPRGRVVEIYGPESSGKTTLTLQVISEMQKIGGICAFVDAEHALDTQYAKKLGATKIATGHNLDDESQAIMMNFCKANTSLAAKLGPMSGISEHSGFTRRIKPLYLCSEKETRLYTFLKGWKVEYTECPNVVQSYRAEIRDSLNELEEKYPGTKHGIVKSFLDILPLLKERELAKSSKEYSPQVCTRCAEPSNGEECNACKLQSVLEGAQHE